MKEKVKSLLSYLLFALICLAFASCFNDALAETAAIREERNGAIARAESYKDKYEALQKSYHDYKEAHPEK